MGTVPGFLSFAPTGLKVIAQGNALGSNVEIESRPERAEPNGAEIHAPMYPGRRFALPWAFSFCPFGAGTSQPYRVGIAWGLSPVSIHSRPASGPDERVLKKLHQAMV